MGGLKAFLRGFTAYFRVIPLFSKLQLWKYLLLTAAISFGVLLIIGVLSYLVGLAVMAVDWTVLFGRFEAIGIAAAIVAAIGVVVLGVLLFKHLVLIATAPWMGKVAERVGAHLAGVQQPSRQNTHDKTSDKRWTLIKRSVRINGRLITFELLLTIPLLFLGLIPGVNIGAGILLLLVQSYFVGAGTLDFTLEERYSYGESVAYFGMNRWLTIGLGLGFVLLLFTAIGFLFAPAWSAAAGAYAFHKQTSNLQYSKKV